VIRRVWIEYEEPERGEIFMRPATAQDLQLFSQGAGALMPGEGGVRSMTAQDIANYKDPDEGKITIEDGCVTLNFQYSYSIELSRIRTEGDLLHWALHLAGKTWMSRNRLRRFIEVVAKHQGLDVYRAEGRTRAGVAMSMDRRRS
jgi:hypothetical protein